MLRAGPGRAGWWTGSWSLARPRRSAWRPRWSSPPARRSGRSRSPSSCSCCCRRPGTSASRRCPHLCARVPGQQVPVAEARSTHPATRCGEAAQQQRRTRCVPLRLLHQEIMHMHRTSSCTAREPSISVIWAGSGADRSRCRRRSRRAGRGPRSRRWWPGGPGSRRRAPRSC